MIQYQVLANPLREGEYFPWIVVDETVKVLQSSMDSISRETGLSDTDVKAVVRALVHRVVSALLGGSNAVLEGLGTFSLSLNEKLGSLEDSISNQVDVRVNVRADIALLERVCQDAHFEKVVRPQRTPLLTAFFDVATGQSDKYTLSSIVTLTGEDLSFNPVSVDEGVFFIAEDGTEERATVYSLINDNRIDLLVPPYVIGTQVVEVRTRYDFDYVHSETYRNEVASL